MINDRTEVEHSEYMAAKLLAEAVSAYGSPETLKAYDPKRKMVSIGGMAELKNQVMALIRSGDLLPCGFEMPRHATDAPIAIPLDMFFSSELNWERSEIEFEDIAFSGVRLLERNPKIKANKFQRSGNLIANDKSEQADFSGLNPSQYINEKEAAKYMGISQRALQGMRVKGDGPEFLTVGKAVRYKAMDLSAWLDKNKK